MNCCGDQSSVTSVKASTLGKGLEHDHRRSRDCYYVLVLLLGWGWSLE